MVYQRDLNGRSMYRILPITKEKIEEYFDLQPAGRGSDTLPVEDSDANPLPANPTPANGSERLVEGQGGYGPLIVKSKNQSVDGSNSCVLKGSGKNPLHPLPNGIWTNRQLVQSAIDGGCTNVDQVLQWVPKNHHTKVGRRDAERCFKQLYPQQTS